jgi:putative transposase
VRAVPQSYAITLVCFSRMRIFQREANASLMLDTLYRYRAGGRFLLHGFVVVPDHMHLLFTPAASVEQAVGLIKGGYSFVMRKRYNGSVWQESYYAHRIVDAADYQGQLAYIAANPERLQLDGYPFVHTQSQYELDPRPSHLGG